MAALVLEIMFLQMEHWVISNLILKFMERKVKNYLIVLLKKMYYMDGQLIIVQNYKNNEKKLNY